MSAEENHSIEPARLNDDRPCIRCGRTGQHTVRVVESSDGGHEDERHHCDSCGTTWWVDGGDA